MTAQIIGEIDSLGYLYCSECHPEALSASQTSYPVAVWSDSDDGTDPCEMCHQPIGRTS